MLPLEDLLKARSRERSSSPVFGRKLVNPEDQVNVNEEIKQARDHMQRVIAKPKVAYLKELCHAEYIGNSGEIVLTKTAGKRVHHFGYISEGVKYLYPEEAIFLQEVGDLELSCNGCALSLQETFRIVLENSSIPLHQYIVYKQLCSLGYLVVKTRELNYSNEGFGCLDSVAETGPNYKNEAKKRRIRVENEGKEMLVKSECTNDQTTELQSELQGFFVDELEEKWVCPKKNANVQINPSGPFKFDPHLLEMFPNSNTSNHINVFNPPKHLIPIKDLPFKDTQWSMHIPQNRPTRSAREQKRRMEFYRPTSLLSLPKEVLVRSESWSEFKQRKHEHLLKYSRQYSHKAKWLGQHGGIKPLSHTAQSLSDLAVVKSANPSVIATDQKYSISYDVHLPDSGFTFSSNASPNFRLMIIKNTDVMPPIGVFQCVQSKYTDNVPVRLAIAHNANVSFFNCFAGTIQQINM